MESPSTSQPGRRSRPLDRLFVTFWIGLALLLGRVALQLQVDLGQQDMPSDLLVARTVDHFLAVSWRGLGFVLLLGFLPRPGGLALAGRGLVVVGLSIALLTGWPGGEAAYAPGLDSDRGRLAWTVIVVVSAAAAAVDLGLTRAGAGVHRLRARYRLGAALSIVLVLVVTVAWLQRRSGAVSPTIAVERILVDLIDEYSVQVSPSSGDEAPRRAWLGALVPNLGGRADGGNKPSIVMAPPAEAEFRVTPESEAELSFSYCVNLAELGEPDEAAGAVEFEVAVDDAVVFRQRIRPGADVADRRWFDARVDLSSVAGSEVRLALRTRLVDDDGRRIKAGFGRPVLIDVEEIERNTAEDAPANVVLIVADTLRSDHLGCYGYERSTSPSIDALAAEGILYENALAPASWTWPSTASLLTGLHPLEHGVVAGDRCFLRDAILSLPEVLQASGVSTGGWSSNSLVSRRKNFDQGFEVWNEFDFKPGARLTGEFREWLGRYGDSHFFAYLHYVEPHHPYEPPDRFKKQFTAVDTPLSVNLDLVAKARAWRLDPQSEIPLGDEARRLIDLYDGDVAAVDDQVGQVLALLQERGLLDTTVVIVTSDHGEEFLDHGSYQHGWTLYGEQLRIPLIIRDPGRSARRETELVDLTQLPVTVAHLMGVPWPSPPGATETVLPGLRPGDDSNRATRYRFAHTATGIVAGRQNVELMSVQSEQFKLIRSRDGVYSKLFHLSMDRTEQVDVSGRYPQRKAELEIELQKWIDECAANFVDRGSEMDEATRKLLEDLGYIDDGNHGRDEEASAPSGSGQ